jgi:hypothetical protein
LLSSQGVGTVVIKTMANKREGEKKSEAY